MNGCLKEAEVVQRIYDVVDAPTGGTLDGWQSLLETTARYLDAQWGHVFLTDPSSPMIDTRFYNYDVATIDAYHRHFQAIDPRFAVAKDRLDEVFSDVYVLKHDGFEKSEVYNDLLKHLGLRYSLFVNVQYAPGLVAPQGYFRNRASGPFLPADIRKLQRLVPHIARALRLRQLLADSQSKNEGLQALLDGMSLPVALLDAGGRLLCASAAAHALMGATRELLVLGQRLTSRLPALEQQLQQAIARAAELANSGRSLFEVRLPPTVHVDRAEGERLTLILVPLRPANGLRKEAADGRVLLAFHDPSARTQLDTGLLGQMFGLTPTEAELTGALAEGKTVTEFAAERGSSELTVRTHLKRVLEKTDSRRQAELVKKVLSNDALRLASSKCTRKT